ncbi:MAG: RsmE family RNA methyltransferase [Phycisphaerales bacterium JB039]
MALHRFFHPELGPSAGPLTIEGEEARHAARVKRLRIGESVEVLSGVGRRAPARVGAIGKRGRDWIVELQTGQPVDEAPIAPRIEVCSACPKGDRLEHMIDQLSQVGAACWRPLESQRSGPGPRAGKLDRLRRVAIEAAKQCGRAWLLEIGAPITLAEALRAGSRVVLLDASGEPVSVTTDNTTILVGPEGGWSESELTDARESGATVARLGPLTMRIEVAAVVGGAAALGPVRP